MKTITVIKSQQVEGWFLVGESVSLDKNFGGTSIGVIIKVTQDIKLAELTIELYDDYQGIDLSQCEMVVGQTSLAIMYNQRG